MLTLIAGALAAAAAASPPVPPCRAAQLSLSIDGRDGDFNGMSHSGTLLLLRNQHRACRIAALPRIGSMDAAGHPLPIVRNVPVGMHPGPVMMPVTIPAGGLVSTPLRWVSGAVYDPGRCVTTARVTVTLAGSGGSGRLAVPLAAHICGPNDATAGFDQPPLRPGDDMSAY